MSLRQNRISIQEDRLPDGASVDSMHVAATDQKMTRRGPIDEKLALPDVHLAFIWELAHKFTNSTEEAEAAVAEMAADIEQCATTVEGPLTRESWWKEGIVVRHLVKFLK